MSSKVITIFHSPDADYAFMFYGLVSGASQYPGYEFRHELKDIESLNHMTKRGELEVSAASVHAYAHLNNRYAILRCGASMGGKDYGPRMVARRAYDLKKEAPKTIAIPGELTSATLALKIFMHEQGIEAELINMDFDAVQPAVKDGTVEAGVIIHEGQITHHREGLVSVLDLGEWWWNLTGLPLPLGVNIARRDLGEEGMKVVQTVLRHSIDYALEHREKALEYALSYGRGLSYEDADRFVAMYVNERTQDIGDDGVESIKLFLAKGKEYGFIPHETEVSFA